MEVVPLFRETAPRTVPMVNRTETELLEAYLGGERSAAEELARATYRRVYAHLMKLSGGRADLAADLTQETYRKAWASLATFDRRSAFSTWLYRIAYNTFLNHQRSAGRLRALPDHAEERFEEPSPRPDQRVAQTLEAERVRRFVLDLPESLRYTVTAHYWGEIPIPQLAKSEGVSAVAIRKRLKKARTLIRELLEEDPS